MSTTTLHYLQEQYAVAVHTECLALFGKLMLPMDAYLSMEAPAHLVRYARLQPTHFHFGALQMPEVQFLIPAQMLDLPPNWPDVIPLPLGALAHFTDEDASAAALQERQSTIERSDDWGNWVELILREAEGCQPSREELAALLSISPTTLSRYLRAEGRSLRAMGKQIRHQRACRLLRETDQAISQIAYRLGYSDLANFSHAFQAEAGISPRTYRQRGQG
jgi:AraC-like DNA-binding protein